MRVIRGILQAIGGHPRVFLTVVVAVVVLSILGPPAVLSLTRKPVDYFTFNPWIRHFPGYIVSPTIPLSQKIEKVPAFALFWFSSDSPYGGTEWGFAVDVTDLARILLLASLFGAYFALLAHGRAVGPVRGAVPMVGRRSGVAGMLTSIVGLSTGPCSVMGCGAPVIPVVGLAFAGLSSGTLTFLSGLSRVTSVVVLLSLAAAVAVLGWQAGEARDTAPTPVRTPVPRTTP